MAEHQRISRLRPRSRRDLRPSLELLECRRNPTAITLPTLTFESPQTGSGKTVTTSFGSIELECPVPDDAESAIAGPRFPGPARATALQTLNPVPPSSK